MALTSITEVRESRIGETSGLFGPQFITRRCLVKFNGPPADPNGVAIPINDPVAGTLAHLNFETKPEHPLWNGQEDRAKAVLTGVSKVKAMRQSATEYTYFVDLLYQVEADLPTTAWIVERITASNQTKKLWRSLDDIPIEIGSPKYVYEPENGALFYSFDQQGGQINLKKLPARNVEGYDVLTMGFRFLMRRDMPNFPAGILPDLAEFEQSCNDGAFGDVAAPANQVAIVSADVARMNMHLPGQVQKGIGYRVMLEFIWDKNGLTPYEFYHVHRHDDGSIVQVFRKSDNSPVKEAGKVYYPKNYNNLLNIFGGP